MIWRIIKNNITMKTISIFGSTGSIGCNAVEIIKNNLDKFKVNVLVAKKNYKKLANQAKILQPKYVVIEDESLADKLKLELKDYSNIQVLSGFLAIKDVAQIKCDLFISAIVGAVGMIPTLLAINSGSNIALANKESLVCAGRFLIDQAKKNNVKIIPIDSEHNAIFQIFENDNIENINKITLTASGGPFWFGDYDLKNITIDQAIKHPNWSMGAKTSIDSATMMNKGLELIEAFYLFPIAIDQLEVLVHPQSIIHGMVDYNDGSTIAMLSIPDMKVPISYSLSYPKRLALNIERLSLSKIGKLEFFEVDDKKFPAVNMAFNALKLEGNMPTILNVANEVAVKSFLDKKISFDKIIITISEMMEKIDHKKLHSIDDVIDCDRLVREAANKVILSL